MATTAKSDKPNKYLLFSMTKHHKRQQHKTHSIHNQPQLIHIIHTQTTTYISPEDCDTNTDTKKQLTV